MAAEGAVLLRDKLASRTMAAVTGIPALLMPLLALYIGITSGTVVAAVGPLVAALVLTFCALTLTVVRTVVTSDEVIVRMGLWGPRVSIDDVVRVRAIAYPAVTYGGWGIKRGIDGSWAYTMLGGTDRVVELVYREGDKERRVVFSAERPEAVVTAIQQAQRKGVRVAVEGETEELTLPEAEAEQEALEKASAGEERRRG